MMMIVPAWLPSLLPQLFHQIQIGCFEAEHRVRQPGMIMKMMMMVMIVLIMMMMLVNTTSSILSSILLNFSASVFSPTTPPPPHQLIFAVGSL